MSGLADGPRRILVTGAHTFWGGRVAQAFESDPEVEVIVGMGTRDPSVPLERTDFVRVQDQTFSTLNRIVSATQVDTIVHTGLLVDGTLISSTALQEHNVIATMNLLAAAGSPGSGVRSLIVKSSGLVYGATSRDPYAFAESMTRTGPPGTPMERTLLDAESLVRDFGRDHPEVRVTVLRFANVLGADLRTPLSRNLARPLCPGIFGYDPLLQFIEQEDVVRALVHAVRIDEAGTFNVGGPGRLPLSEVAAICGSRILPLPPWQTGLLSPPRCPARALQPAPRPHPAAALRAGPRHQSVGRHRLLVSLLDARGHPRVRPHIAAPQGSRDARQRLPVPGGRGALLAPRQLDRRPAERARSDRLLDDAGVRRPR